MDIMDRILQDIKKAVGIPTTLLEFIEKLYETLDLVTDRKDFKKVLKHAGEHVDKDEVTRIRERLLEIREKAKEIKNESVRKIFEGSELAQLADDFKNFVV